MKRSSARRFAILAAVPLASACRSDSTPDAVEIRTVVDRAYNPALSPDGTRIAYAQSVNGQSAVFVANADGSNPVQLTHGVWDNVPRWSPDGRWIAYAGEAPQYDVFIVSVDGGEPRQLTSGPAFDTPGYWLPDGSAVVVLRELAGVLTTPAFPVDGGPARMLAPPVEGSQEVTLSPDGTKAAYDVVSPGGELSLWVQDLPDGEPRRIGSEGFERAYRSVNMWSPDSRSIAFVSDRTGTADIWIADAETGEIRQLTSDLRNDVDHVWSPDGRWIAFVSDRGGQTDLWIVPSAGGSPRRVTDDLDIEEDPRWSPDGGTLYFHSVYQEQRLTLRPIDGSEGRVLAGWPGYRINTARVSPDGRTALFVSDRSGTEDLWTVPLSGGDAEPLSASPLEDRQPDYSPDGARVVFTSNRAGSFDLWVMPSAGGEARRLTDWPSSETGPSWSPDGSRIAFVSDRASIGGDVWVVPAEGGEAVRLTRGAAVLIGGPAPGGNDLQWSPDGSFLYIISVTDSDGGAFRVRADGGAVERLGSDPHAALGMLSPDGNTYATFVFRDGWGYLDAVPAAGGAPRRLTRETERVYQSRGFWTVDGSSLIVTAEDLDAENYRDLWAVSWPDGDWRRLTQTPAQDEESLVPTPDGQGMLIREVTSSDGIRAASVAPLLAAPSGR